MAVNPSAGSPGVARVACAEALEKHRDRIEAYGSCCDDLVEAAGRRRVS